MSSSTSSFNLGEWRVVLFLGLSLLIVELVIRQIEPQLSRDLAHIRSMSVTAEAMRDHSGKKILLLGNSLTRQAVSADVFVAGLRASGRTNPALFWCVPDGTNMMNWDYCLGRYFIEPGALPDEIFMGTGPLHLMDARGDASRLAAYHVGAQDVRRVWSEDLKNWEEGCEFLLSRVSVVHASRHRIKPHVFGRLVPHYFDVEQWINTQRDVARLRSGKVQPTQETYRHLKYVLDTCRTQGVKIHLFTVPLPDHYKISQTAVDLIQQSGAIWLPISDIPGLSPAHFPDSYHLNAAGAEIFTHHLIESLATRR